jgi:xylan 1,4-beta-xylosidase
VFRMYGAMRGNYIPTPHAYVGADQHSISIMIWNYADDDLPGPADQRRVVVKNLPKRKIKLTEYRIDSEHSNAYEAWKKMGSPQSPTVTQYQLLEAAGKLQELAPAQTLTAANGTVIIPVDLPRQAVSLLRLEF